MDFFSKQHFILPSTTSHEEQLVPHVLFVHNSNSSVHSVPHHLCPSLYFNTENNVVLSPQNITQYKSLFIYLPRYRLSMVYYFQFRRLKISYFQPPEMYLNFCHLILCLSFFRIANIDLMTGNPVRPFLRSKPLKKFYKLLLSFSRKLFLKLISCNTTPCFLVQG